MTSRPWTGAGLIEREAWLVQRDRFVRAMVSPQVTASQEPGWLHGESKWPAYLALASTFYGRPLVCLGELDAAALGMLVDVIEAEFGVQSSGAEK